MEPSRDGGRAVAPAGRGVVVGVVGIVRAQLRERRALGQREDVQGAVVRGGARARQERVVAVSVGPDEELRRGVRVRGVVRVEDGGQDAVVLVDVRRCVARVEDVVPAAQDPVERVVEERERVAVDAGWWDYNNNQRVSNYCLKE